MVISGVIVLMGQNLTLTADLAKGSGELAPGRAVTTCPPGKVGIYFFGQNATALPFQQGIKCIANPVRRLPPVRLNCFDAANYQSLDLNQPAGATCSCPARPRLFQYWFRDANPQRHDELQPTASPSPSSPGRPAA